MAPVSATTVPPSGKTKVLTLTGNYSGEEKPLSLSILRLIFFYLDRFFYSSDSYNIISYNIVTSNFLNMPPLDLRFNM